MSDDPHLEVALLNAQTVAVDEARIVAVARRAAASEGAVGELSVVLVDEPRMVEMNTQYLGECGPTDVLSFSIDGLIEGGVADGDAPPFIIGEVIVCPEVAAREARRSLAEELDLLVAHGVLHLLGYDHDTEEAASAMRARESVLTGSSGATAT